jgi:hypothetical protein
LALSYEKIFFAMHVAFTAGAPQGITKKRAEARFFVEARTD